MTRERILVILMRLTAAVELLALAAVVMPTAWMAAIHARLGLGEMPQGPLVEYLTRSISAMYAVNGAVLLVTSLDVRRYRPLVVAQAWLVMAFGAAMLAIDVTAGLPAYWVLGEGPFLILFGAAILVLLRGVPRSRR
jgi:hypothetical protein